MSKISKAEQYLVEQIRQGNSDAWSQLVDRYRGRLLNFAQTKVGQRADAEDVVQEVFINFIRSVGSFRQACTLETYLFTILRRRIIELYRSRGTSHVSLIQDLAQGEHSQDSSAFSQIQGQHESASWYVRRDEEGEIMRKLLADALSSLLKKYKQTLNLRDMQVIELIFYCQMPNFQVAQTVDVSVQNVGVIKHRCLKQIREDIATEYESLDNIESLLTEVWEDQRLSCLKRSTIGAYMLGTLDEKWQEYIEFHLNTMGCHFCRANLDDLQKQNQQNTNQMHTRIMESTIGFLRKE